VFKEEPVTTRAVKPGDRRLELKQLPLQQPRPETVIGVSKFVRTGGRALDQVGETYSIDAEEVLDCGA
jgi:hypothetical protein